MECVTTHPISGFFVRSSGIYPIVVSLCNSDEIRGTWFAANSVSVGCGRVGKRWILTSRGEYVASQAMYVVQAVAWTNPCIGL